MKRFLLSLPVVLLIAAIVTACPVRKRVIIKRAVVVEKVAVVEAVTPVFVPLLATVPASGTSYVPPASPVAATPVPQNDAVLKAIEDLSRRLQALERNKAVPAPPPGLAMPREEPGAKADSPDDPPRALAVVKAHCADCHSGSKPKGNFSLVDAAGRLAVIDAAHQLSLLKRINRAKGAKGAMPPDGPLDDESAAVMTELVDSLK